MIHERTRRGLTVVRARVIRPRLSVQWQLVAPLLDSAQLRAPLIVLLVGSSALLLVDSTQEHDSSYTPTSGLSPVMWPP